MRLPQFTAMQSLYKIKGAPITDTALSEPSPKILPQLRRNPFLNRQCEDTAFCLNEPGNCGIPRRDLPGLRAWYIQNCGGFPDLVAGGSGGGGGGGGGGSNPYRGWRPTILVDGMQVG